MGNLFKKYFLNEKGELSFRKTAITFGAIGGFCVAGAIPGAQVIVVGKALIAAAAALGVIGQLEKNERKTK